VASDDAAVLRAVKDRQSVRADWQRLQDPIAGVRTREIKNVVLGSGSVLCEVFRREWRLDDTDVDQVFQTVFRPGNVSAWHVHRLTTDRLFVSLGVMKIVLYDGRPDSPTHGRVNEFCVGDVRPTLIIVPPGVFHGVQNISDTPSLLLNLVDRAYRYEDPDHWRVPLDTDAIPYRFETGRP
jgi:dTDP-4-dehydrorhamnose 3,5-epimerase